MGYKLKDLANSFKYAFWGIRHCIVTERNFRIHMVISMYVITLGLLLGLDKVRFAVLFLTISTVLVLEMLNTAIESLVDLASPMLHPLAKVAKDVAAGAVLVSAIVSVAVGCILLWQPDRLVPLAVKLLSSPAAFAAMVISLIGASCFVFGIKDKQR